MPSLKPLDRPAKIAADVFSFLVPKTSNTMTNTINQCQNARLPMMNLPWLTARNGIAAAKYVDVKMKHFLTAATSGVDQRLEARFKTMFFCQARRQQHDLPRSRSCSGVQSASTQYAPLE